MNGAVTNEPRAWTFRQWWGMGVTVFLVQLALIIIFGAKKPPSIRAVAHVPTLELAKVNDEFITLDDPTLFALPHANDFGADKRMQTPALPPLSFRSPEPTNWLALSSTDLLTSFGQFTHTNHFAEGSLDFKPEPVFTEPSPPTVAVPQPHSTLNLRGNLARRPLLETIDLTDWPAADLISPSKVQVLVDAAGQVISAALLPPDYVPDYMKDAETHDDNADQRALELARAARFAPGSQITVGQMIFNWHVVAIPATGTNGPPKTP